MPNISIIIATYNSDKTLRIALDSVLNQNYQDWECVIVDGASKDQTLTIVKEFEEKDSRFRHISESDRGIYDAFNKGWQMAKGEWIHYLGDDDWLTPDGFQILMQQPLDGIDVVTGHCYIKKIDGTIKPNYSVGLGGCHQGKLTRRSVLERYNGFDMQFPVLADKDLMLRMESGGVRVLNVNTFVAYFSMTGMSQKFKGLYSRSNEYYIICRRNGVNKPFIEAFSYFYKNLFTISYRKMRKCLK